MAKCLMKNNKKPRVNLTSSSRTRSVRPRQHCWLHWHNVK